MIEGTYTPPLYRDLYNFLDGAQNDIFENTTGTGSSARTLPASDASPPSQDIKAPSHNSTDRAVQPPSYVASHEGTSHTNAGTTKLTEGGYNHHQSGKCSCGLHQ